MYTVTIAARISQPSFASDAWKASAVPWKPARKAGRQPDLRVACSTARTASPSDVPGDRLNDSVTAGNCAWWLMVSGALVVVTFVSACSGTWWPSAVVT